MSLYKYDLHGKLLLSWQHLSKMPEWIMIMCSFSPFAMERVISSCSTRILRDAIDGYGDELLALQLQETYGFLHLNVMTKSTSYAMIYYVLLFDTSFCLFSDLVHGPKALEMVLHH